MPQSIDFLPLSYHQRRQRRRKQVWRRGVLAVLLLAIVLGAFRQRQVYWTLQARRDELRQQAERMSAQLPDADVLRRRIRHLEGRANLVTLLRLRVRPTRILATIADRLPRSVMLSKTHYEYKTSEPSSGNRRSSKSEGEEDLKAKQQPHEQDLERLEQRRRETALVVEITGLAPDDVAVSEYLSALEATRMFDEVRLLYTDQHAFQGHRLRNFGIRLRVKRVATWNPDSGTPRLAGWGAGAGRSRRPGDDSVQPTRLGLQVPPDDRPGTRKEAAKQALCLTEPTCANREADAAAERPVRRRPVEGSVP